MTYQYTIEIKNDNATSYLISYYDYLDVVLIRLEELIKKDRHYKRPYYVYNEFYNNVFPENIAVSKYKILVREVSDWYNFNNLNNFINKDIDNNIKL